MGEKIRKRFVKIMGLAAFLAAVWFIREYGIFDMIENLFRDPMGSVPSVNINP